MMTKQIEDYIRENLKGKLQITALEFIAFLRKKNICFYKDNSFCWKNKIYYWIKFKNECIAFIAIKDPDEPENLWTIWFDDSKEYATENLENDIKMAAWKHIDFCRHCGSCSGGRRKNIFGKDFHDVCGCTFRMDNAVQEDLPFLKTMVDLRIKEKDCKCYE